MKDFLMLYLINFCVSFTVVTLVGFALGADFVLSIVLPISLLVPPVAIFVSILDQLEE